MNPYQATDNFFVQKMKIRNVEGNRFEFFKSLCQDKRVMHIGCADAQFFDKDNNLHVYLKDYAKELLGMDPSVGDLDKLQAACPGTYFADFSEMSPIEKYDTVIVPEVLEHVLNAQNFLNDVFKLKAKEFLFSVPNVIHYAKEFSYNTKSSQEIVHPDHKYWFSPYTLYSLINHCLPFPNYDMEMLYLEGQSMIALHITNIKEQ